MTLGKQGKEGNQGHSIKTVSRFFFFFVSKNTTLKAYQKNKTSLCTKLNVTLILKEHVSES